MSSGFAGLTSVTAADGSSVGVVDYWTSSENWLELHIISPSGERSRIELDMEQAEQLVKGLLDGLVGYRHDDGFRTPFIGAKPLQEWMADEAARFTDRSGAPGGEQPATFGPPS